MKFFSKVEVKEEIDRFFCKDYFSRVELKKIIQIAMKYKIRLGRYRRRFCKKCLCDYSKAKSEYIGRHNTVMCGSCGYKNKIRIS